MSQTNIDYLFQVIAPTADRAPSIARSGGGSAGFDDHLSQASACVLDVGPSPSRADSTAGYSTSDERSSRCEGDDAASDSGDQSSHNLSLTKQCTNNAASSAPPSDDRDESNNVSENVGELRDADKTDEEEAPAIVGAAQPASNEAPAKSTMVQKGEHDAVEPTKTTAAPQQAVKPRAKHGIKANESLVTPVAQEADTNATAEAAATAESKMCEIERAGGGEHAADEKSTSVKDSKHGKSRDAAHAAVGANEATRSEKKSGQHKTTIDDDTAAVSDTTEKSSARAKVEANGAAATDPPAAADSDTSSDDKPRRGAKSPARTSARNDSMTAATKPDATSIASGAAANFADALKNGDATEDASDRAAKPGAAKTETAVGPLGRALRATTEITRGNRSTNANETPPVDPARFVARVAKAFQTAHDRGGTLQLRLSPPELGSLKLQLTVKDGVMSAALETDNANARRVLLDHLPALRDRLAEQNIRVERFDVDVRQENNSGQANPRGSNQNPYQQQQPAEPRRPAATQQRTRETAPPEPPAAPRITTTGINLVV